jgi:hypothetical protein
MISGTTTDSLVFMIIPTSIDDSVASHYYVSTYENNRLWLVHEMILEFEKTSDNNLFLVNEYLLDTRNHIGYHDFNYTYWYRIWFSGSGKKWIFSNGGLFLLDEKTRIFREFRDAFPSGEFRGSGYLVWSPAGDGIYIYDQKETNVTFAA